MKYFYTCVNLEFRLKLLFLIKIYFYFYLIQFLIFSYNLEGLKMYGNLLTLKSLTLAIFTFLS